MNVCGLDREAKAGVNFDKAMSAGGIIYFSCGANPVIYISKPYTVSTNTVLMGPVTLQVSAVPVPPFLVPPATMFSVANSASLTLNQVTVSANFIARYVVQSTGGSVTLDRCQIENTLNGFFLGQGSVTVTGTTFATTLATAVSARTVEFTNSTFSNTGAGNTASAIESTGGSTRISGSTFNGGGRVVCSSGTLDIDGSRFTDITAPNGHNGGAISLTACKATISNSTFGSNRAAGGGAIAALSELAPVASSLSVTSSQFSGNTATTAGGGAIFMQTSLGIGHALKLRFVDFNSNSAEGGGAIDLGGQVVGVTKLVVIAGSQLDASAVTFKDNSAKTSGGAIRGVDSIVGIARGLFSGNKAGATGGAVSLNTRTKKDVVFANSLFIRNTAMAGSAFSGNVAQFVYSTISGNTGTAISDPFGSPAIAFANSILSGNEAGCDTAFPAGGITNGGHNLQFPNASCGAIPVADPQLDSMFIPTSGSPAQAAGDNVACASPAVNHMDLLGQYRPRVSTCTIGAMEGEIESLVRTLPDPEHRIPSGGPDFSVSVAPVIRTLRPGGSASFTITAVPVNGFGGKIAYSVSGAPPKSQVTVNAVRGMFSSLTVTTGSATPNGTWSLTVSGTGDALTRSVIVTLSVSAYQ